MKTTALLLASALLLPATGAFAQSFAFTAPEADLRELVGCHSAASHPATPAAGTVVTYFGVETSHNTQHEQFARLRQVVEASKPTLVFFEKPDLGVDSSESLTITRLGESGYARYLAQQHGAKAERLDDPLAEYDYLRARLEPSQLKLYYLLRVARQYQLSTGASRAQVRQAMAALIAQSSYWLPGTEQVVPNVAALQATYRAQCPSGHWEQAAMAGPSGRAATFMAAIEAQVREYRAQRLQRQVAEAQGERVLVVLDRAHLPAAPATLAQAKPRR
ncbi:hypothetical protein [Hymenobacter sp. BRD67]|uniref:hypothetical protein n=1 Tax=Hymenobacter sp. BRD67 TaxID=2675877 RepID=UPI0015667DEA|nr:hypothetical protein [Hymenobacter sp. BRD67]QKG51770.1 hypothetical protein GKZ67_03120 [Hymenobacter sp. BRD67]